MHSPTAHDLAEQIARARGGCPQSLGELLEMYRNYLVLMAQLQVGDKYQAKFSTSDVIQETYLQARRGIEEFRGRSESEWLHWLRKIFASQLATQIRHFSTQQRDVDVEEQIHAGSCRSSVMLATMLPAEDDSPSHDAMRRERAVLLADALAQLPADHREIITRRHLRGQSFPEIATALDRSVDSVKGVWRRAIGALRELLGSAIQE